MAKRAKAVAGRKRGSRKAGTSANSRRRRVAARALATPPGAPQNPRFEAIALTLTVVPGKDLARVAAEASEQARLRRWRVEPVAAARGEFELVPPRGASVSPGGAWDATYRLRDLPAVVHAEPLFEYSIAETQPQPQPQAPGVTARGAFGGEKDDPATDTDFEWSLDKANVIEAWKQFGTRQPGAGVVIGHPDTGYTPHPEMGDPSRILAGLGFDFKDNDPNAIDDLVGGPLQNPSHGTGTGSVILSERGPSTGRAGRQFVSGVAPFASLLPIRTTESVLLLSMRGLRRAIDYAVAKGVQVISMGLGGPVPSDALRQAVRRATDAGTIVLAAAGNQVRFVVFPAAFDEVIAVAASTVKDAEWPGSCRGDAVDITAPGASVWRARTQRAANGDFDFTVERGSGTSFAVATTAGVAALWVSLHGWNALAQRYGAANIADVFKSLLQRTCRTPKGWDTRNFGPGLVDAAALLAAPLPEMVPARKLRSVARAAVATDTTSLGGIIHMLPDAPRMGIEHALAEALHVDDRDLSKALQEVGDEFAFQLATNPGLRAELTERAQLAAPAPARGRRAARVPRRARAAAAAPLAAALDRRSTSSRLAARLAGSTQRR